MEPEDVKVDTWYCGDNGEIYWHQIEEVLRPNDPWKAFSADDGCRYGYENHYVIKD